ncbi:MAG: NAD(P)-dependent oxidoreductase [Nanoarchaeota archaeon]|nr:NAD(P)-dependent oxidoreductase [Nanoarchaeota archaeon]
MKKLLITGANGFIGRHLTKHLETGCELLTPSSKEMDVTRLEDVINTTKEVDYVFHLAAKSHRTDFPKENIEKAELAVKENVSGIKNVLMASTAYNVSWILFSSSALVYETSPTLLTEDSPFRKDEHHYARSKIRGETLCSKYKVPTCIPRVFNGYGPGQEHQERIVPDFIKKARKGTIDIFGDGREKIDLIHVQDVVKAMKFLMEKQATGTYNIGSGTGTTFFELAETINRLGDFNAEITENPQEIVPHPRVADTTKIKKLGWKPKVTLEQGIESML